MKHRPILVGIDNPHSRDPKHALYPLPAGCTGWRLWQMLRERTGVAASDYAEAFQRVNVSDIPLMTLSSGALHIPEDLVKLMRKAPAVVLLGDEVRRAFSLPKLLLHPIERDGVVYRQVPHPSGRNHFYNHHAQRDLVAVLLEELYRGC